MRLCANSKHPARAEGQAVLSATKQVLILSVLAATACTNIEPANLQQQVAAHERAFAQTMAERDFDAFRAYLSDEAVFFGAAEPLRGAEAVANGWRPFFEGAEAPFSWQPETVEVLASGRLALSTGPVYDAAGKRTMTFTSIWRQQSPGVWRIVFDRGNRFCGPD